MAVQLPPGPANVVIAGSTLATVQLLSGGSTARTLVRDCDDQTAMRRGLAEFAMLVAQRGAPNLPPDARNVGLHRCFFDETDWEQVLQGNMPVAAVDDESGYTYDWAGLGPDPTGATRIPGTDYWIAEEGSVLATVGLTVTATDVRMRDLILQAIKQPFMSAQNFNGIRLRLDFFHGVLARYTLENGFTGTADNGQQRLREGTLMFLAEIPIVSVYRLVQAQLIKVDLTLLEAHEDLTIVATPATMVA